MNRKNEINRLMVLMASEALLLFTACSEKASGDDATDVVSTEATMVTSYVTYASEQSGESINENNVNTLFENDNVVVNKLEPLLSPNVVCSSWDVPTEDELYSNCDAIALVTIDSLEEVGISYSFMDTECISYKTLADVSLDTLYYSADENIGQEFTIAIPNSSYSFDESFPEVAVGESYVLFISDTEKPDDSLELDNYSDYYLSSPANIVSIDGSECCVSSAFSSYSGKAAAYSRETNNDLLDGEILIETGNEEEAYDTDDTDTLESERYIMPFDDFEGSLKARIKENAAGD